MYHSINQSFLFRLYFENCEILGSEVTKVGLDLETIFRNCQFQRVILMESLADCELLEIILDDINLKEHTISDLYQKYNHSLNLYQ
jgi:hypothetical protein